MEFICAILPFSTIWFSIANLWDAFHFDIWIYAISIESTENCRLNVQRLVTASTAVDVSIVARGASEEKSWLYFDCDQWKYSRSAEHRGTLLWCHSASCLSNLKYKASDLQSQSKDPMQYLQTTNKSLYLRSFLDIAEIASVSIQNGTHPHNLTTVDLIFETFSFFVI